MIVRPPYELIILMVLQFWLSLCLLLLLVVVALLLIVLLTRSGPPALLDQAAPPHHHPRFPKRSPGEAARIGSYLCHIGAARIGSYRALVMEILRKKLLSTAWVGAWKACLPRSRLLRRSVSFEQTSGIGTRRPWGSPKTVARCLQTWRTN